MASQGTKGGYESIPGKARSNPMATKVISDQPKQLTGEEEYVLNLDPTAVQGTGDILNICLGHIYA